MVFSTLAPSNPCGVHAPSAIPDGKGGIVVIFNMNPGKKDEEKTNQIISNSRVKFPNRSHSQGDLVNKYWGQIMTLPRRISLNVKIISWQSNLIGNIESLRFEAKENWSQ